MPAKTHKRKWSAKVKTEATFPPSGIFTKPAEEVARTMARKDVSPRRDRLRHPNGANVHKSSWKKLSPWTEKSTGEGQNHSAMAQTSRQLVSQSMKALIFDLDGTLIDSVYAQVLAWQKSFDLLEHLTVPARGVFMKRSDWTECCWPPPSRES
jgi:hypothetical protein